MSHPDEMVKVQFYDKDVGYENLWAKPLGNGLYEVESIPFFIYEVSRHDVVSARPDAEGRLQFVGISERSGHRTLRARPDRYTLVAKPAREVIEQLRDFGCGVETLEPRVIAIDIPASVSMASVTKFLTDRNVPWEYANPTLASLKTKPN